MKFQPGDLIRSVAAPGPGEVKTVLRIIERQKLLAHNEYTYLCSIVEHSSINWVGRECHLYDSINMYLWERIEINDHIQIGI